MNTYASRYNNHTAIQAHTLNYAPNPTVPGSVSIAMLACPSGLMLMASRYAVIACAGSQPGTTYCTQIKRNAYYIIYVATATRRG